MYVRKSRLFFLLIALLSPLLLTASLEEEQSWAPDLLIIGAQKSGTTSLYRMLCQHPEVTGPVDEVHFFDLNFHRGVHWYRRQLQRGATSGALLCDKSPYYLFHPLAPERAKALFPNLKIIVLLRNPVDRAYSHFWHCRRLGVEPLRSFEEALAEEEQRLRGEKERLLAEPNYHGFNYQMFSYCARGLYLEQIQNWCAHFPPEQMLVLSTTDLKQCPQETADSVFAFLVIPPLAVQPSKSNSGRYPPLSAETREKLTMFYRPHNRALETLLKIRFGWD